MKHSFAGFIGLYAVCLLLGCGGGDKGGNVPDPTVPGEDESETPEYSKGSSGAYLPSGGSGGSGQGHAGSGSGGSATTNCGMTCEQCIQAAASAPDPRAACVAAKCCS